MKKKQLIISVIATTLCVSLLLASSWALFSDRETGTVQGKAGTVEIGLDCFALGNSGTVNPGDGGPNDPNGATAGTPRPLDFNVNSLGNELIYVLVTFVLACVLEAMRSSYIEMSACGVIRNVCFSISVGRIPHLSEPLRVTFLCNTSPSRRGQII